MSASRMATRLTSGRSRPSRSRLMPTSTSKGTQAQIADDLHAFHGVDVVVHIAHLDACPLEIAGEVLRHLFGQVVTRTRSCRGGGR